MTIEINAKQAALVATSVAAGPGGKLAVDGAAADPLPSNHAFLGFRGSHGRRTAMLRNRPDVFVRGSGVSTGTLLLFAVLFVRAGRAVRR